MASGGLKITPTAWICDGERVAVEADSHMKLQDGREYRNQYHFSIQLRDGKICRIREYMDTAHVAALSASRGRWRMNSTSGPTATPNAASASAGPLQGVKVLELGSLIAGPYASALLAQFGAEVIKIEPPGRR